MKFFWPCNYTNDLTNDLITVRENDTHSLTIDIGIQRGRYNISITFKSFSDALRGEFCIESLKRKILLHGLATLYKLVLAGKLYIFDLVIMWAIKELP